MKIVSQESLNKKIHDPIQVEMMVKENQKLKALNEACTQMLKRKEDWKKNYQSLSRDNQKLRKELERWQTRTSPVELALRYDWLRPTCIQRTLTKGFVERELGEYLWYQLELIEPGLRFCGEQVQCGNGYVDFVAEDRYYKHVLIELKVVEDDPRLLDQVARYPKAYSRLYGIDMDDIRMIVIAPSYGKYFRQELQKLGVTVYQYNLNSNDVGSRQIITPSFHFR